jgi:RNA polymerase sigma factor (sigma-70 family)
MRGATADERLSRRASAGDRRAFAAIFRRYHQPLFRYCLAILGDREDAEEALQNAMVKVMGALPGEERRIELKPWLYRIAHNESVDLLRRRRQTRVLDAELPAPGPGLAEDAATRERLAGLIADLGELPERQRQALVLRELAGLKFSEIGAALGTSAAVARQTLYEARQGLRRMDEGREMSCQRVSRAISDGDGRVLRRRDVRAHLRGCPSCRAFREEIRLRRRDLAALSPLPAVAAAGLLHGLLGGQGAAGGGVGAALGGGAAKTIGASAAAKGIATAAVVAAIGVGAADRAGVIHIPLSGKAPAGQAPASSAGTSGGAVPLGAPGAVAVPGGAAKAGLGRAAAAARRGGHSGPAERMRAPGDRAGAAEVPATGAPSRSPGRASPSQRGGAHPHGGGQVKQHPTAAGFGQGNAAAHKASGAAATHKAKPSHGKPGNPAKPAPSLQPGAPPPRGEAKPAPQPQQGAERGAAEPSPIEAVAPKAGSVQANTGGVSR